MKNNINYVLFGLLFLITNNAQCFDDDSSHLYEEMWRPQVHYTPRQGWMNDPNGMIYIDGEYHLFYQYHPYSNKWGPMHWGHATSVDLLHWKEHSIALFPDRFGTIFSGSVVFDSNNTSGLGTSSNPPLVAVFTYANYLDVLPGEREIQSQGLAFSLDKGKTWKKYEKNPILPNPGLYDFRDPKISWHEKSKKWIMALAVGKSIRFYQSNDLLDWRFASEFGSNLGSQDGVWECPDLIRVEDQHGIWHDVLIVSVGNGGPNGGSGTQYFIGNFDGKGFKANDGHIVKWLDYGTDNYAGVTWSNTPKDEAPLFIGWMSNWDYAQEVPTVRWRSAMTSVRQLKIQDTKEGMFLTAPFIPQIANLSFPNSESKGSYLGNNISVDIEGSSHYLTFNTDLTGQIEPLVIKLSNKINENLEITFDASSGLVTLDRKSAGEVDFSAKFIKIQTAPMPSNDVYKVELLVDQSSVEILLNDGLVSMSTLVFPNEYWSTVFINGQGNQVNNFSVNELSSIWRD